MREDCTVEPTNNFSLSETPVEERDNTSNIVRALVVLLEFL